MIAPFLLSSRSSSTAQLFNFESITWTSAILHCSNIRRIDCRQCIYLGQNCNVAKVDISSSRLVVAHLSYHLDLGHVPNCSNLCLFPEPAPPCITPTSADQIVDSGCLPLSHCAKIAMLPTRKVQFPLPSRSRFNFVYTSLHCSTLRRLDCLQSIYLCHTVKIAMLPTCKSWHLVKYAALFHIPPVI